MSSQPMLMMMQAEPAGGGATGLLIGILPWLLIFAIFYLLMIRPQQRRMKDHQAQIMAVKKGDRVVTGGGLIGKVTRVMETEVEVELAQGIRVTAVKSTLTQVVDPKSAKPAND
jgi:preprotein translocase subunit YajC